MLFDFLFQFLAEFVRALLVDELSEHVRSRVKLIRRNRNDKAGKATPSESVRSLSTDQQEEVT